MNELEAIKLLKVLSLCNRSISASEREALEEAIEALSKQIPVRPIYSEFDDLNDDGRMIPTKAKCPSCNEEFEFGTWNGEENHHCKCGQAISWDYF